MDRITRRACDPGGLQGFYVKINTSAGSEVGLWMKLNGNQQHKPMKKYLQQCYLCTKAGACSVAQDVGTDCVLSASFYSSEATSAVSTDVP